MEIAFYHWPFRVVQLYCTKTLRDQFMVLLALGWFCIAKWL